MCPGALEVSGDADGIAPYGMDVAGGQLDQALVQRPFGEVGGAHPGRLEEFVRFEEVAPLVRRKAGFECRPTKVGGNGSERLPSIALRDRQPIVPGSRRRGAAGPLGAAVGSGLLVRQSRSSMRRLPSNPSETSCHHWTRSSPRRQHNHIGRPATMAGKSMSPVEISRSSIPQPSSSMTAACI